MEKQTRRKFMTSAATIGVTVAASAMPSMEMKEKKQMVHHVFFWLKDPGSKKALNKLIEGINTLKKIETLRMAHIGVPAETTKRDVIDDSYQVSLLTAFDDIKGHDTYQEHPIHLKFVKEYSELWTKVVVYDSMDL